MRTVTIHVCVTCKREDVDPDGPRPGALLRDALARELPDRMDLHAVECLGNCKRGCTVALTAPESWTYVFGDLVPQSVADVITAADLLAGSPDRLMPWRGRPDAFKYGMIARIPPLEIMKDAAE